MRHSAVIDVSEEALVQALGMPRSTRLIAAKVHPGVKIISLEVEHESLPEVEAGAPSPNAMLVLTHVASEYKVLQKVPTFKNQRG